MTDLEACAWAGELLKRAGFILRYTSMQTEACYYSWPGHDAVLRVAAHAHGHGDRRLYPVIAKVTLSYSSDTERRAGCIYQREEKMLDYLARAIGIYMLRLNGAIEISSKLTRRLPHGYQAPTNP